MSTKLFFCYNPVFYDVYKKARVRSTEVCLSPTLLFPAAAPLIRILLRLLESVALVFNVQTDI